MPEFFFCFFFNPQFLRFIVILGLHEINFCNVWKTDKSKLQGLCQTISLLAGSHRNTPTLSSHSDLLDCSIYYSVCVSNRLNYRGGPIKILLLGKL